MPDREPSILKTFSTSTVDRLFLGCTLLGYRKRSTIPVIRKLFKNHFGATKLITNNILQKFAIYFL
jgi:hypothetical protein